MKSCLDLNNFLLGLCNFHEDDGAILIPQSHQLGIKKSSQPMNVHCPTIVGMSSSCINRNMIPKETDFLNKGILVIFTLILIQIEESIHVIPFGSRSGPLVVHGYLHGDPFNPWPTLTNDRNRVPMTNRGSSSSEHVTVSHSGRD